MGALLAVVVPMVNPSTFVRTLLATTGLLALVSCGAVLDGANQFPGPAALWPVGAAAFLIIAGANIDLARMPVASRAFSRRDRPSNSVPLRTRCTCGIGQF